MRRNPGDMWSGTELKKIDIGLNLETSENEF
jgi:hypothetical protein